MKRSATHLLAKITFFSKLSNFYFDSRSAGADPRADSRARERSENPTPGATRMCECPGVARGMVRLGIDRYINWRHNITLSVGNILPKNIREGARRSE